MLKVLKSGATGYVVTQWQVFLRGQGFLVESTGSFDDATVTATRAFQTKNRLDVDGVVGNQSYGKAAQLGFELVDFSGEEPSFPAKPNFLPLAGNDERQRVFGPLEFVAAPTATSPEALRITNGWTTDNLERVTIPQLMGIRGARADGVVAFHRKGAQQLKALWKAWEQAGVLTDVLTFEGAFDPRFVRGRASEQILSNHAFATAFDINYAWNKLGAEPATAGAKGSVYKLVPIAHTHGFYWGGHFTRKDGMHFELAVPQ
jgi:hypothetical protein